MTVTEIHKLPYLKDMISAFDAGARGDANWLEISLQDLLIRSVGSGRLPFTNTDVTILRKFQHGLDSLRNKRIAAGTLDLTDNDMADPKSPIKTIPELRGLISGLKPSSEIYDRAAELFLGRPDSLEWALWHRLGWSLSKEPSSVSPLDYVLKGFISRTREIAQA